MKNILSSFFLILPFLVFASGRTDNLSNEYFEIANAYAELKNYSKAIEFYEKASTDEKYKNACEYNLARMFGLQNDWTKSTKLLQNLHKKEPNNKLVLSALAYSLVASGSLDEGKKLYKDIADSEPENPESTLNYIRILVLAKDYETAKAELEKAILNFPSAKERIDFDKLKTQIEMEKDKKENPTEQTEKK